MVPHGTDAAELRVDVRVARAEPVAERRPQQLAGSGGRSALHDEVLAVEEISRVLRVGRRRAEAGERREGSAGPFPAVADQLLGAPGASARGMTTRRLRVPAGEVEDAVHGRRLLVAPRVPPLAELRGPERRALELRLGRQPQAAPARVCAGLR